MVWTNLGLAEITAKYCAVEVIQLSDPGEGKGERAYL
jgi:hypothetical protein